MIELTIDNLTFGGRGVGRLAGKAVFVPYVLPGEKVGCRIAREHKRYSEADLVEVLVPAATRRPAECPVFADCGGCHWQHLPYRLQLEWKERIFREALTRTAGLEAALFQPIIASPAEWHYRCRARVKCQLRNGRLVAGFYRRGSHQVVEFDACPLLAPELNRLLARLKRLLAGSARADRVRELELAIDDNGMTSLVVHLAESDASFLPDLLAPLAAEFNCALYQQHAGRLDPLLPAAGATQSIRPLGGNPMQLQFPPGGFVQVNLEQNRQLVAAIAARVAPGEKILDLFCGIGNFSLPLAGRADSVTGIEDYAPAIAAARTNAAALGYENCTYQVAKAERILPALWRQGRFDTVILDPPRAGAAEVAKQLATLKPAQIIYVSCDPMTLARDLKPLLASGYRPELVGSFDMFPQTYHIEGLVVLKR